MGRTYSTLGEVTSEYKTLVITLEGKRPIGISTCIWVDNIRVDLRKIRW